MATIRKRGNTYQIRVSCGYDTSGNQVIQTTSWKPEPNMTARQAEKEVQKQAMLFEEKCLKGQITANVKFETFAEQWFEEYAKLNLRHTSYERMRQPMNNNTPYCWFTEFCKENNFRFCDIHSMRHFYASALINEGVDAAAVSGALGHSVISTTTSIYCHAFQQAQARASDAIASVLDFSSKGKQGV